MRLSNLFADFDSKGLYPFVVVFIARSLFKIYIKLIKGYNEDL